MKKMLENVPLDKKSNYQPQINFCPKCGHSMRENESLIVEYWNAEKNIYFCWCHSCCWKGEITKIEKITTTEIEE